jgi:hypothetical protein
MTRRNWVIGMTAATVGSILAVAGPARAETVHIEAESCRGPFRGGITSPLMIKDSSAASMGSYVEVVAGNNNQDNQPTDEGVARYNFTVFTSGTYRIWARVMAPTNKDDSFWVRMNNWVKGPDFSQKLNRGKWFKWNDIPLGTAWHWVLVKADGAVNPSSFSLLHDDPNDDANPNLGHQLEVAYREDGAKVDLFLITSDLAFNPNATPTGPPAAPQIETVGGRTRNYISWEAVPGATSYRVERQDTSGTLTPEQAEFPPFIAIRSGVTTFSFTDTSPPPSALYRVFAIGAKGTSEPSLPMGAQLNNAGELQIRSNANVLSVSAPMFSRDGEVTSALGVDSLTKPPAHGRARFDFQIAQQVKLKVWVNVRKLTDKQDSFWVRMDDGPWVKWNGITTPCDDVHDSDKAGKTMVYDLAPGSHRYEFAPREGGSVLSNIVTFVDNMGTSELCSD